MSTSSPVSKLTATVLFALHGLFPAMLSAASNMPTDGQAEMRAQWQSLTPQCADGAGGYSAAACADARLRGGPEPAGSIMSAARILEVAAETDCVSTIITRLRVETTGGEFDGQTGDRMFVVIFDDGVIEFAGSFDAPLNTTTILDFQPFSYPDPNIGQDAPGIAVAIYTRQPFEVANRLDIEDPVFVAEETNCAGQAPIVDLNASPTTVAPGGTVRFNWLAQRVQGSFPCVTFDGQGTSWAEERLRQATDFDDVVMPSTPGQINFGLECQGENGLLGQDSVLITIAEGGGGGGGVNVDLVADPGRTAPGGVINLSWTSNAPTSGSPCRPLAGGTTRWSQLGLLPANGRRSLAAPATAGQVDFVLECSNGQTSGNDVESVSVAITPPPPPPVAAGVTSLTADGRPAAGTSKRPSITRDGSALIFETTAANIAAILPSGQPHVDNNGSDDIFLITSSSAVSGSGAQAKGAPQAVLCSIDENDQPLSIGTRNAKVAATGAGATFESDDGQVRTFDGGLGRTRGATSSSAAGVPGNGMSANPDINQDATAVVFDSTATNLVASDANGFPDVFMKNPQSGAIEMMSMGAGGQPANGPSLNPAVSGDGLTVFFETEATNMDGLPVASSGIAKGSVGPQICGVRNTGGLGRSRTCITVDPVTGQPGNGGSRNVAMSQNGDFGVFESDASNLVQGDTNGLPDIFWFSWDGTQATGIVRVSTGPNGEQANGASRNPSISDDGMTVTFESEATNLVPPDNNGVADAFVKFVESGQIQRFASTADGGEPNGGSSQVVISGDGSTIAFGSDANNIIPGDANDRTDVFVVPNPQVIDANEPALQGAALPAPNPPNASCPSGFFIARVNDGPAPGVQPGIFGLELLLDDPGTRLLAGGLNFGGLVDRSQVGFAAINFANPANENQLLNVSLTGSPRADLGLSNLPVRLTISRRSGGTSTNVFQTSTTLTLGTPFQTSIEVPPGFYVAEVAVEGFGAEADRGAPEGQFFFSLTTSFVGRPGGGFQGGAVVGGYHAENPFGGVSGFAAFCLATPHSTSAQVFAAPTYGSTGAQDLSLQLLDAGQQVIYSVP